MMKSSACALVLMLALGVAPLSAGNDVSLSLVASDPAGGLDGALSPDGQYFVASSSRSGVASLWLFNRAEADWERLTDDDSEDTEPAWSPDGTKIAFTSWRGDEKNIWILTLSDRSMKVLTPGSEEEEYAAWSPDGTEIVYTGGPWKSRNFFLHDLKTGASRALLKKPEHAGACTFHPTGDTVLCHTYSNGYGDIIRIKTRDGTVSPVTSGSDWHYKPAVSPDSERLAFTRIADEDEIHVAAMNPEGGPMGTSVKIADGRWPVFGNDGRELFFHRLVEIGSELRILDRRTGKFEVLVTSERKPGAASLSPDGALVAYCSKAGEDPAVWIHDRATDLARKLDADSHPACYPSFSPDGRRIALTLQVDGKWEIATLSTDASESLTIWTRDQPELKNLDAPITWSPDGSRLVFAARTAPYESDLFILDLQRGNITNVTKDAWYDEGPSFSQDGQSLVFMSTRGGDWTWGLFQMSLDDGALTKLTEPDYIEKGYPFQLADGTDMWLETNACLSSTFIVERSGDGERTYHQAHAGARWAVPSADADEILFAISARRTEYWVAEWPHLTAGN